MNKHIFKSIQQSMINSTFLDFYFPDNVNHRLIEALTHFQEQSSDYRLKIFSANTETQLKQISEDLTRKIERFDSLSKEDFPHLNYFFSSLYKNDFNYQYMKELRESNYQHMSFLKKINLSVSVNIPERYEPNCSIKKAIFDDFGFQYLHIPYRNFTKNKTESAFYNFIDTTKLLMKQMQKEEKSISIYGELGLFLEGKNPFYGHLPKCIGFTPNITPSSILHEWTHSIDNYVFHKLSGINDYASENLHTFPIKNAHFLPVYQSIKKVLFDLCNMPGQQPSTLHEIFSPKPSLYYINCGAADEDLFVIPEEYYKKPCEILARMVEGGEFPNQAQSNNKALTNTVYLRKEQNPYLHLKDILFSVVDKPLNNITKLRKSYVVSSESVKELSTMGKFKM